MLLQHNIKIIVLRNKCNTTIDVRRSRGFQSLQYRVDKPVQSLAHREAENLTPSSDHICRVKLAQHAARAELAAVLIEFEGILLYM